MVGSYKTATRAGILRACLRFIEDPNRPLYQRAFLAAAPLFAVFILSPLDLLPEIIMGPLGLTDDVLILIGLILLVRLANAFYKTKRYFPPERTLPPNSSE